MTTTINSIDQIKSMTGKIYVRWSKSINLDNKRGYSLRYGREAEAGLSVCSIDKTWEDWRIIRQIQEYAFLGGSCWIVTGDECGRGGDDEELLENVVCLAKVSERITKANWRKMELVHDIAENEKRLENITDDFGKKIVSASIEKYKKELAAMK